MLAPMSDRRVFIHGGCISRDAVDFYPQYGMEMVAYVARQSLISAYSRSDKSAYDVSSVKSSFQRRMFAGDVAGNLPTLLRRTEFDLLIWDLMIERVGVGKAPDGRYITRNMDFAGAGVGPKLSRYLNFGTEPHFEAWSAACRKHVALLEEIGALEKVVLNATPWASVDDKGAPALRLSD